MNQPRHIILLVRYQAIGLLHRVVEFTAGPEANSDFFSLAQQPKRNSTKVKALNIGPTAL